MSNANDWPVVDAHNVSLPTIVSSSDLFDGELFGDELIDIYNSTVGDEHAHEIPHLPVPTGDEKKMDDDTDGFLNSLGDGLGAFRPSTSFNDLSKLLENEGETSAPAAPVETTQPNAKPETKKRANPSGASGPAPKRKVTGVRRVSVTKKDMDKTATSALATAAAVAAAAAAAAAPVTNVVPSGFKVVNTSVNQATSAPKPVQMPAPPTHVVTNNPVPSVVNATTTTKPITAPITTTPATTTTLTAATEPQQNVNKQNESGDFKTAAQAAVSNFMVNVNDDTCSVATATTTDSKRKVDTSTAHIKALTGNNWVAACAGATQGIVTVASAANDAKSNNRARRQNLTPDERARQNRDRNREHARNTRLRKKAYVEELKRTLTELVAQRDAGELEKRQSAQRELEQREVRFRVIEEFLKLRGRNETNFARWAAILEDGFVLTTPPSDFRKVASGELDLGIDQVLNGVSNSMADSSTFSSFLQTLGNGEGVVSCHYNCERKNFFMDGCQAVLEWTATSVGAMKKGAPSELTFKGQIRGKFSPASNKLLSANIAIDSGMILIQMQKLSNHGHMMDFSAAQAAATQADAILDSLEMPCLPSSVPSAVIVHPSSVSSSSEKGDSDSDESVSEPHKHDDIAMSGANCVTA